jgi:hypothetical protein
MQADYRVQLYELRVLCLGVKALQFRFRLLFFSQIAELYGDLLLKYLSKEGVPENDDRRLKLEP